MIIESGTFEWSNGAINRESQTDIEIYRGGTGHLVIATEKDSNTGLSITNGAELMWPAILKQFHLDPGTTVLIEHYKYPNSETWDIVTLPNGGASWSGVRKDKMDIIMRAFSG